MKQFWMILSGAFALIAFVFLARQDYDKAFVCAALAVAWFLRYRTQMKELVRADESTEESSDSLNTNEEE